MKRVVEPDKKAESEKIEEQTAEWLETHDIDVREPSGQGITPEEKAIIKERVQINKDRRRPRY